MKTIKDKLIEMLENRGLSNTQAKQVISETLPKLEEDTELKDYKINFNDSYGAYPPAIYNIIFEFLKPLALGWIKNNKPEAWFRPLFEGLGERV